MGNDPKMEKAPEEKGTFYQEVGNSFFAMTDKCLLKASLTFNSSGFPYAGP